MKININPPIGFTSEGPRQNNEDYIFPSEKKANKKNNYFLVCDGVGGEAKGEIASKIACDSYAEYFENNPASEIDNAYLSAGLTHVEEKISHYIEKNQQAVGMGTTLTLLFIHDKGIELAWCGDSRIYHVRNNKILYQTEDHSYVNELVKAKVITKDEIREHPDKNRITRAIQGNPDKKAKIDVHRVTDIQPGDYFFLCTDGVWEPIEESSLLNILTSDDENTQKAEFIKHICAEQSSDNYSGYLIQVNRVEGDSTIPEKESDEDFIEAEPVVVPPPVQGKLIKTTPKKTTTRKRRQLFLFVFLLILLILLYKPVTNLFEKAGANKSPTETEQQPGGPNEKSIKEDFKVDAEHAPIAETITKNKETVKPELEFGTFTDERDGQTYRTIQIGNQIWMAENLNFKTDSGSFENNKTIGTMYTWNVALEAIPKGWKLPSDEDWMELEKYIGLSEEDTQKKGSRGNSTGLVLFKENVNNINGSNKYGFSAFPNPVIKETGSGSNDWFSANFWTSSPAKDGKAIFRELKATGEISRLEGGKQNARAARCIKE